MMFFPRHARLALAFALLFGAAAPAADADVTLAPSAWDAWARSSPINRCFSSFPPLSPPATFGASNAATKWSLSKGGAVLDDATYKHIATSALAATKFATAVPLPKPDDAGTTFSAEREGAFVAWSVQQPGGTTDGFAPASGAPAQIATGTARAVEAFRKSVPPEVFAAAGQRRCGYKLVPISDAKYPGVESGFAAVLLMGGKVVGFYETAGD